MIVAGVPQSASAKGLVSAGVAPRNSQTASYVPVVHMYAGSVGYRHAAKITPFPRNNFGWSTNFGKFVIDEAIPKFKQIWSHLTPALALGPRVDIYASGCSGGGTSGLPLVTDIVVRSAN